MDRLDVDEIVVITLKESTDRQKSIREQFPSKAPFRFHVVDRDPEGGRAGCYRSHAAVIADARKRNLRRLLVLEDDACLVNNWDETVQLGNAALRQLETEHPDWHYLLLYMFPVRNGESSGHIRKVFCAGSAAAYIVNLDRCSEELPAYDGRHVDNVLFCNYTGYPGEKLGHGNYLLSTVAQRFVKPLTESQNHMYATNTFLFRPDDDFQSTIDPFHKFAPFLMKHAGAERFVQLSVSPGFDIILILLGAAGVLLLLFLLLRLSRYFFSAARERKKTQQLQQEHGDLSR